MYWQFVGAIQGMGDACRAFESPVTGGNVSFYNQTVDADGTAKPVYPTPTIGMVGLMEDADRQMTLDFKEKGELIFMLGESRNDIGCSEYLSAVHGVRYSPAPALRPRLRGQAARRCAQPDRPQAHCLVPTM